MDPDICDPKSTNPFLAQKLNEIRMTSRVVLNVKILFSDVNVQIESRDMNKRTTGEHSLHKANNGSGQRLIDLTSNKDIGIDIGRFTCFSSRLIPQKSSLCFFKKDALPARRK